MAIFKPFKGIRPDPALAKEVAALPYDVVTSEEAREIGKANPYSFLHIDRGEIDLPEGTSPYDQRSYDKAKDNLNKMINEGILLEDDRPFYYIYELTLNGRVQTGLVGTTSIDDYMNGVIKKHELTRADKEEDRIRHVDNLDANTGPIYLAADFKDDLKSLLLDYKNSVPPVYDFEKDDKVTHRVWVVNDKKLSEKIESSVDALNSLYIADGHHRAASAVKVGIKRREENPEYSGDEEFNFFMSVIFPYDELTILPYNRVITDLNGLDDKAFLSALKFNFELMIVPNMPCKPIEKHFIGMYLDEQWYMLRAYEDTYTGDVVSSLDVSILQNKVLTPVLGIEDPRVDKRISFVGGNKNLKYLSELVDSGKFKVAFAMYPTSMEDLMKIADEGKIMPPKSTWFEPKLLSGLFIHKLS